jgi:hypothetical protein
MWARDIKQAIEAVLESRSFEEASLDHDLGQGDKLDGIVFVDWMSETGRWPGKRPRVHSMNPPGRQRMLMTIERYFPG